MKAYSTILRLCVLMVLVMIGTLAQAQSDDYNPTLPDDPSDPGSLVYYKVSVTAGTSAAGTVSGAGSYRNGTEVVIKATANSGYKFLYWTCYGVDGVYSTDAQFTYTVANDDASFTAVFEKKKALTLAVSPAGAGTVSGATSLFSGETATVSTTANANYVFQYWQKAGEATPYSYDQQTTFTMQDAATTLTAVYVYQEPAYTPTLPDDPGEAAQMATYNVTLASNYADAGTQVGAGKYKYGTEVTVSATVDEAYRFLYWQKGDDEYSDAMSFVYTVTPEDVTFTAVYEYVGLPEPDPTYTLLCTASPEGSCTFSPSSEQELTAGATFTVTATPSAHHTFLGWYQGDVLLSTDATYTGTMTAEGLSLTACLEYVPTTPDDPTMGEILPTGDVNGNYEVSLDDLAFLIAILNGKATDVYGMADVNGDSLVTLDDVTSLLEILMEK